jgi:hypothetical protein
MLFLSTRNYDYFYNFIVKSAKKNCEIFTKKKLDLLLFDKKKIPSLKYLIFFIYIIFSGKIFKKNRARICFDEIEIGRFVLAKTLCVFECYENKLKFYKILIKNFFYAGSLLSTCAYYQKKYKIEGAYVDHCGYLNGIIFSFFALKKISVYSNNYPLGIYFVNYKQNKKTHLKKYENTIKITIKKNINKLQKHQAEKQIIKMIKKKDFIPYLAKATYKKLDNINYKIFDYVIYTHSFTDGQLWYGFDGFENTLQWLEFTLNKLIQTEKKILIKPHPNFYNNSLAEYAIWDKKIYETVVEKYKNYKNLHFLRKPSHNYLLLKKINKNCIIISKFGTSILEASYMNFKSICSSYNFFDKKFCISNMWDDKDNYLKLLNCDYIKLKLPNKNDLLRLIYALFYFYHSEYHINFYNNIIRKNLNLTKKNYETRFSVPAGSKIPNSKIRTFNSAVKFKENLIVNQISKTIWQVKI